MVGTGVPEGRVSVAVCCRQQVPGRHGRLKLVVVPEEESCKVPAVVRDTHKVPIARGRVS